MALTNEVDFAEIPPFLRQKGSVLFRHSRARPMDFSVIGIDGGWFIEAWRSSNGLVDQASSCSAPDDEVSG